MWLVLSTVVTHFFVADLVITRGNGGLSGEKEAAGKEAAGKVIIGTNDMQMLE